MLLGRGTPEARANQRTVHVNGYDYVLSEYVGAAPVRGRYVEGNEANDNSLPQGFLVEQPPGSVTPPHFHEVNQFQVFVAGSGVFGKKPATPLMVHYAGGHTPYGPIAAGPEGVSYFTLRAAWDPGAKYMPKSRDLLKPVARRHRLLPRVELRGSAGRAGLEAAIVDVLHEPEADALAAYLVATPAHGAVACPSAEGSGGQYHVVVGGSLVREGKELPELSCYFATPDEPAGLIQGGGDGLEMLVLQFPRAETSA